MIKSLEAISLIKGEYGGGFSAIDFFEGAPRYVRITDINEDGELNDDIKAPTGNSKEWKKYSLEEGDILFARSGATVGKTFLYRKEYGNCIFAGYLIRFKIDTEIAFPKYVFYFTKTPDYFAWIKNKQNVVAQPNINAKQYGFELQIPIPSLETQQRIASILDAADALRKKTQQIIDSYDELAQSIFLDMFGDPVTNPKGWEKTNIGESCYFVKDGPHVSPKYVEKGVPFVSVNNIIKGYWDLENVRNITEEDHRIFKKRCNPQKGDILYTKGGTTGFAKYIDIDLEFSNWVHLAVLKFDKSKMNGRFFESMLNSNYCYIQSQIATRGIANRDLVLGEMKKIIHFRPPISLQTQFAEKIALIEQQKELAKQSLKESEDLFNALLQKAFKGELV